MRVTPFYSGKSTTLRSGSTEKAATPLTIPVSRSLGAEGRPFTGRASQKGWERTRSPRLLRCQRACEGRRRVGPRRGSFRGRTDGRRPGHGHQSSPLLKTSRSTAESQRRRRPLPSFRWARCRRRLLRDAQPGHLWDLRGRDRGGERSARRCHGHGTLGGEHGRLLFAVPGRIDQSTSGPATS